MEDTHFKLPAMEDGGHVLAGGDQGLPADTGKIKRNATWQSITPGVFVTLDVGQGVDEGGILGGRMEG